MVVVLGDVFLMYSLVSSESEEILDLLALNFQLDGILVSNVNLPSDTATEVAADLELVVVPVEKQVPCLPEASAQDDKQAVNDGGAELLQIEKNQHSAPCEGELDGGRVALVVSLVVVAVVA